MDKFTAKWLKAGNTLKLLMPSNDIIAELAWVTLEYEQRYLISIHDSEGGDMIKQKYKIYKDALEHFRMLRRYIKFVHKFLPDFPTKKLFNELRRLI